MSVPELPSNISHLEETFKASLRRVYILTDKLCSDLTKSQERLQIMFNSMVAQHQHLKLQMKPHAVSASDISISKVTLQNILVSTDMYPDIYPVQGIT